MIEIKDPEGNVLASIDAHTLEGADLSGRNLARAQLAGAHLRRIILRGSKLNNANLRGAVLCGADLEGADLGDARLERADLDGANLRKVKADRAQFVQARLHDADLSGGSFVRASFHEAYYSHTTKPALSSLSNTDGYGVCGKDYRSRREPRMSVWDRLVASKERHLTDAVQRGDLRRAEELLKQGAKPDAPREPSDSGTGTVLHSAIYQQDDQMLDLLIRQGANLEARGEQNFTPIQFAVYVGNGPALLALIRAGADQAVMSDGGRNLLSLAFYYQREGMADLIARLSGLVRLDL